MSSHIAHEKKAADLHHLHHIAAEKHTKKKSSPHYNGRKISLSSAPSSGLPDPLSRDPTASPLAFSQAVHNEQKADHPLKRQQTTFKKLILNPSSPDVEPISSYSPSFSHEGDKEEENVSEDFINEYNAQIGSAKNIHIAQRLLNKMRLLGGLIPGLKGQPIDIPAARLGMSMLAGLNHFKYKMQALDELLLLLQKDPLTKESSIQLVALAIQLMKQMNREWMQGELLDVQIKIIHIYSLVAELLQRHYAKKHINAITKELKVELINTSKALAALNTQEDPCLDYYVHLALEGTRRLVDDRKELFTLIERFYHAAASIVSLVQGDAVSGFMELAATFKDLDPHVLYAWYNGILVLNELGKAAQTDPDKLTGIQVLLREKRKQFDWKFTYAALKILLNLTLHGDSIDTRTVALQGLKIFGPDFPGLLSFAGCRDMPLHRDLSPMLHLKKPRKQDPNILIRRFCMEHLLTVTLNSKDPVLVKKAKLVLIRRLRLEKNASILAYLKDNIPESKEQQVRWLLDQK